jgi:hypothetical protein
MPMLMHYAVHFRPVDWVIFLFEFSLDLKNNHLTFRGFHQQQLDDNNNLVLYYDTWKNNRLRTSNDLLTVVVPFRKDFALTGMERIIAGSVLLAIVILVVFYYTTIILFSEQKE